MKRQEWHSIWIILLLCSLYLPGCKQSSQNIRAERKSNKAIVIELLQKGLGQGDIATIESLVSLNYKQHSTAAPDGRVGLVNFVKKLKTMPKGTVSVKPIRIFDEGPFVLIHSDYSWFGKRMVVFDLFRVEKGKVVEHWDAMQPYAKPNPSGRSMLDGPVKARELALTQKNKALVKDFVQSVLVKGQFKTMAKYFDGDNYRQHNPGIGDGLSGLGKAIQQMAKKGITMKYSKIHRVIAQGNFVLTQSEGEFAGKHVAFYDLFRVEKGKIAEHWDVIQDIPKKLPHKNGVF